MNSGIYIIKNHNNGKIYVGSTKDLHAREISHRTNLKNKQHPNRFLQEDYNNGDKLEYIIVEYYSLEELKEKEQYYMNYYNANFKIYNLYPAKFENWDEEHSINVSGKNNYKYKDLKEGKVRNNEHDGNIDKRHGGIKNPKSKLSLDNCKEIKKELMKGLSVHLVAKKFNVSSSTIKDIRRGNHWSNKELGGNLVDWLEKGGR